MSSPFVFVPTAAPGSGVIEVPVRSASLPVNLWQRRSSINATNAELQTGTSETDGDWHHKKLPVQVMVAAGDTVLAGAAILSLSNTIRREQGIPDTDEWGIAFDGTEPLAQPFVGPGTLLLPGTLATRGAAWPSAVSVIVDLFILRSSLVPDAPPPFAPAVSPARRLPLGDPTKEFDPTKSPRVYRPR